MKTVEFCVCAVFQLCTWISRWYRLCMPWRLCLGWAAIQFQSLFYYAII